MKKVLGILMSAALIVSLLTPMSVVGAEDVHGAELEVSTGESLEQNVPQKQVDASDSVTSESAENLSDEASQNIVDETTEKAGSEVTEKVTEEVSKEVTEEVPEEVTEEVPGEVTEEVPGEVTEEVPGEVAEEVPGEVTEKVPGKVTEEAAAVTPLFIDPESCSHTGDTYVVQEQWIVDYAKVDADIHQANYETQNVTRCLSCGMELKREAGSPGSFTQHHSYDESGNCYCGAHVDIEVEEGCKHTNTVDWASGEIIGTKSLGPGFHEVTLKQVNQKVCMNCGKVLEEHDAGEITRLEHHYFNEGSCYCGEKNTCTHGEENLAKRTILLGSATVVDVTKTGHVMQRDTMVETYCTKCNDVLCIEMSNVEKQEENHVFADGLCIVCNYEMTCAHEHTLVESGVVTADSPNYTYVDAKTHQVSCYEGTWTTCMDCGEAWFDASADHTVTKTESHEYAAGKCVCGAKNACEHTGKVDKIQVLKFPMLLSLTESNHTIRYSQSYEMRCADCGELITTEMSNEQLVKTSEHTFVDGVCTECGYEKPTTEPEPTEPEPTEPKPTEPKPTTPPVTQPTQPEPTEPKATEPKPTEPVFTEVASDEKVHGVKVSDNLPMTEAVTKVVENIETSETAKIQIRNVDQILNQEEVKQMEAIPAKEQVFAFLTVMGFGDTINKALEEADEQMSQQTVSLIESIQTRMENMTEKEKEEFNKMPEELFPVTTMTIDGVEYEWFQFEIQIEDGDSVRIERYGFRLEDGEWILSRLETADVEE